MSTLKNTPEQKDEDLQRKENEGPNTFQQEFKEEGTPGDLQHGGYQRGDQGGYQGGYDEDKFEQHPLAQEKKSPEDAGAKASDAALIEAVRASLADGGPYLDARDLGVQVHDGVVTLSGEVDEADTRASIEAAVAGCAGLSGIDNRIVVART